MALIPPFHPHSEALMSNLASRSHEWKEWEIEEIILEFPLSAKSRGMRKAYFRIKLSVTWIAGGLQAYVLTSKSSPTRILLERKALLKDSFKAARILARRLKNSHGLYKDENFSLFDKFLTPS